jgi:ABC-type Fe3+-siderophore transport system permease subunit
MFLAEIVQQSSPVIVQSGVGLGSMLAITFSWARNRSIFWAIIAGIFSWFYVIYFALTRRQDERRH